MAPATSTLQKPPGRVRPRSGASAWGLAGALVGEVVLSIGCAGQPAPMSPAEQLLPPDEHCERAAQLEQRAAHEMSLYDPNELRARQFVSGGADDPFMPTDSYNPTERHRKRAAEQRERAARERELAQARAGAGFVGCGFE